MKLLLVHISLLLITIVCSGQTEVYHVSEQEYVEFIPGTEKCESDTTQYAVDHEVHFIYPHFQSNQQNVDTLNKCIEQQVISMHPFAADEHIELNHQQVNEEDRCVIYSPFRTSLSFEIQHMGTPLLSFDFLFFEEACCGGHGSRWETIPFTYDFQKQKRLYLKDITLDEAVLLNRLNHLLNERFEEEGIDANERFKVEHLHLPFSFDDQQLTIPIYYPEQIAPIPFTFCYLNILLETLNGEVELGL